MLTRFANNQQLLAEGTHIYFFDYGKTWDGKKHKTSRYGVYAKADNFPLGTVSWFGRWRKYTFQPAANTVYEETCMRDISQFIEEQTKSQRAKT